MAQTSGSGSGADRRRLGRGLSALVGGPVPVQPPPSSASPEAGRVGGEGVAGGGPGGGEGARGGGSGAGGGGGGGGVVYVAVDAIVPSPFQPRRKFDEGALAELSASIKSAGLVQPVLVRVLKEAGGVTSGSARYELIAGERRWRASRMAGLAVVPCVVREATDEQAAEWALIENLQRADLSTMERAHAVRGLADRFGLTHGAVAERLGIDRSSVANMVRLTELEEGVQGMLDAGELSAGHAKLLLTMPPGAERLRVAMAAGDQAWSVRELETALGRLRAGEPVSAVIGQAGSGSGEVGAGQMVEGKPGGGAGGKAGANGGGGGGKRAGLSPREIEVRALEKRLGEHLGTKVRIHTRARGDRGRLAIEFYGLDHFEGLMEKMGFAVGKE